MKNIFTKFSLIAVIIAFCSLNANAILPENFEEISNFDNWSQETISGSQLWTLQEGLVYGDINYASEGLLNACFSSYNYNGDETLLVSPQIDLSSIENPVLRFSHIQPAWSIDQDELRVYYKTTEDGAWRLLIEYTENIENWRQDVIVLPDACETYFIGFLAKSNYGYGVGIDDIIIDEGATCTLPGNLTFKNIKETSTLISWEYKTNVTYEIEYGESNFIIGEGQRVSNIQESYYQIIDLSSIQEYSIYIRVYCSEGVSAWAGPFTFNTTCHIGQVLPYFESFENNANPLECWQVIYANAAYPDGNAIIADSTVSYQGENSIRFSSYEVGSPYDQYLISPYIEDNSVLEFSFVYRALESSSETFTVGFSDNPDNPLSSINWLNDIVDANQEWTHFETFIPENTCYIVIHYKSVYEYYLYLDNIRIGFPIDCSTPDQLSVSEITTSSANISWAGDADEFTLEYGFIGFEKGTGTTISGLTALNKTITELDIDTAYDAYVYTDCEGTKLYSDVISFSTNGECEAVFNFEADNITETQAIITWGITGEEDKWNVEYGISGFEPGTGTLIEGTFSAGINLVALTENTQYDIYAQAFCEELQDYSEWSDVFTFKTLGDDVVIYVEIGEIVINPIFIHRVSIKAVNETNYICGYDNSPQFIDLKIENTGNVKIEAGTEITYTLDLLNKGLRIKETVALPFDLLPTETYNFSSVKSFIFTDIESTIQVSIVDDNIDSRPNVFSVRFIKIINEIIFSGAENNIIETNELPSYIYTEFNTNFDFEDNKIIYKWHDGTYGLDRIAYNEGVYTLTVTTEYCISTGSVELKQVHPNQDCDQNFEIFPNPSHGQITITNDNPITSVNVDVYDSAGRKVFSTILSGAEQQADLSSLSAGIYNLSFTKNNEVVTKRLFIE